MTSIKKVFKNVWFYGFLLFFVLLGNYILHGSVFSFGSLGKWTFFQNVKVGQGAIRKSNVDDTVIGTTLANIKLGKGDIAQYYFLNKALEYIERGDTLINMNVVEMLDSAENKTAVLESHLKDMQNLNIKINQVALTLNEIATDKKLDSQNCKAIKSEADRMFFEGINLNDESILVDGLNDSLENGPCYIEDRIMSNAYYIIYDKLNFYSAILDDKIALIEENQEMILQNFQLFKDNLLDDLVAIRDKLNSFKIINSEF